LALSIAMALINALLAQFVMLQGAARALQAAGGASKPIWRFWERAASNGAPRVASAGACVGTAKCSPKSEECQLSKRCFPHCHLLQAKDDPLAKLDEPAGSGAPSL
jgi:hypothetical protein